MTTLIESTKKPEFELKPIEQIIKRYKQLVRECNKGYEVYDEDTKRLSEWDRIRRNELAWVLCKD